MRDSGHLKPYPKSRIGRLAWLTTFGIVSAIALGGTAQASTATASFGVTATVQATCLISATSLAFGVYTGVIADGTSTISVTCTNTTPYTIGLGVGLGTGATVTTRHMTGTASAVLNYGLYQDAAFTINWGTTPSTDTEAGTGTGAAQPLLVHGHVPAGQYVAPGAYTDTIIATITF